MSVKIQPLLHGASKMPSAVICLRISYANANRDLLATEKFTAKMWTNVRYTVHAEKILCVRIHLEISRARVSMDSRETRTKL